MRKLIIPLAVFGLVAGYQGYKALGHRGDDAAAQQASVAPVAEGVTGATIKRPAVSNPNVVDFGHTVNSVDNYALKASEAGKDQPLSNPDQVRDQQIDAIVNKITSEDAAAQDTHATAHIPLRRLPAVPVSTAPESTQSSLASQSANGTTGAMSKPKAQKAGAPSTIANSDMLQGLPAPISEARNTKALDAALKAYESPIIPRPRWRREHNAAMAGQPPQPKLPRGI